MYFTRERLFLVAGLCVLGVWGGCYSTVAGEVLNRIRSLYPDATGAIDTNGAIDTSNPFFGSLGTNSRTCETCHQPSDAWSVTPKHIQQRFEDTLGLDPIFRPNDGANCDNLDTSSLSARESAYSLLLNKGLIRVALNVPAGGEFTVVAVDSPYGCSSATSLSLYRRPLPSANLRFLTTVMWDGRESFGGNTLEQNLMNQANDATTGHAQGAPLSDAVKQQIVAFELGLHTAQSRNTLAGDLNENGANGGPDTLAQQSFSVGVNDPLNPPFNPRAMNMFDGWQNITGNGEPAEMRRSIARGQELFNTKPITITGVKGLNDLPGLSTISGTCTTCHNTPNVGNHSVPLAIDIGVSAASRRTSDMPLYTLENSTTHEQIQTMDPGRAMITGKWKDIGKTKGPVLRGLAARAPYFHNGSAASLDDVLDFYETRFGLAFTDQERADLIHFLNSL